jgi:large subunit ribosomal protein L21
MYAVIQTGGKQHRVEVGEVVRVERLAADAGEAVVFDEVLMIGEGDSARVGVPTVEGAQVRGTVVEHGRADKVLVFTFKRRQNSNRRRNGHRQDFTAVKIDSIDA